VSEKLVDRIAGLMPGCADNECFVDRFADLIEQAGEMDDLELLRNARASEEIEKDFKQFVESGFPHANAMTIVEGDIYKSFLGLAKLDREVRKAALRAIAGSLRTRQIT